jgi:hypothetical protein
MMLLKPDGRTLTKKYQPQKPEIPELKQTQIKLAGQPRVVYNPKFKFLHF